MYANGVRIIFNNGIIEGFELHFKSIKKDNDRYFDALYQLSEDDVIETKEILKLSGAGGQWITSQYLERGLFDLVEGNLLKAVTDKDFYGPLHQNTQTAIKTLLQLSRHGSVQDIYRAAIKHRLRHLQNTSNKRRIFYLPACKKLLIAYEEILKEAGLTDADMKVYAASIKEIQTLSL